MHCHGDSEPREVELVYRPRRPEHYVARLRGAAWAPAGWGWTEPEAIASLADAILADPTTAMVASVRGDRDALIGLLTRRHGGARLDPSDEERLPSEADLAEPPDARTASDAASGPAASTDREGGARG